MEKSEAPQSDRAAVVPDILLSVKMLFYAISYRLSSIALLFFFLPPLVPSSLPCASSFGFFCS